MFNSAQNQLLDREHSRLHSPSELKEWSHQLWKLFSARGDIRNKFLDTYRKEWEEFIEEFIDICSFGPSTEIRKYGIYEKYLRELERALTKGHYNWGQVSRRRDVEFSDQLALEVKLHGGRLNLLYQISGDVQPDLSSASLKILLGINQQFHISDIEVKPISGDAKGIQISIPTLQDNSSLVQIQDLVVNVLKNELG